jgi:hypothetical protein
MKKIIIGFYFAALFWCSVGSASSGGAKSVASSSAIKPTLIGAINTNDQSSSIYMPDFIYDAFLLREPKPLLIALNKVQSMVRQYICTADVMNIAQQIKVVLQKPFGPKSVVISTVIIKLNKGAVFVIPENYFCMLDLPITHDTPSALLTLERRNLRSFLHVLTELYELLLHVSVHSKESTIREYFASSNRPQDKLRFKKVVSMLGKTPQWLHNAFIIDYSPPQSVSDDSSGCESGFSDSESTCSGDFSSTESMVSASSFSGEDDSRASHAGGKKMNLTTMLFLKGDKYLKSKVSQTPDGAVFDLSEEQLTSIDDLSTVVESIFTPEESLKITALDLSGNNLYSLGDRIFESLPKLKYLTLSHNPLRAISSKAFNGISLLECLCINHAPDLTSLPADLWQSVWRLRVLRIENTGIEKLLGVEVLSELEILSLPQNSLAILPNMSGMTQLRKVDLSGNKLVDLGNGKCFPRSNHGVFSLALLRLDENRLSALPSWFYDSLPQKGLFVSLCNNNLLSLASDNAAISAELLKVGFERVGEEAVSRGTIVAHNVSDAIFDDVRDKLCTYLGSKNELVSAVVSHEIKRSRMIACINPMPEQESFLKRNAVPIACVASTVVLFAVGGGFLGYFFIKKAALTIAAKVAIGASAGAAGGGILGGVGAALCYKKPDESTYLNTGGAIVCMAPELKSLYIGVFREISFLSLLKQYLVATALLFEWICSYDEYADNPKRIDILMTHLEADIALERKQLFARIDDATTIAMIHELITENPMQEINRHVPADLFDSSNFAVLDVAKDADLIWLDERNMLLIRTAIATFSKVACVLRAVLVNRYIGTYDHAKIASIITKLPELEELLSFIVESVANPLMSEMERSGEAGDTWFKEVENFKTVSVRLGGFLKKLAKHKNAIKLLHVR